MEAFFVVHIPRAGTFTRHDFESLAIAAATTAARDAPGEPVYLLRAVKAFTYRDPVEVEALSEPDDIPF